MMLMNLLKKIGVFFLSLVFGLWTLFVALSISVRADSLAWSLDLLGLNNPIDELLIAYDMFPILSAGGSIELAKFNTYDEFKEWWTDEMTSRIGKPSDVQESLQVGLDAYRVAGSTALSSQDSLLAKINQRYLALQIGYAKDFVDKVVPVSESSELELLMPLLNMSSSYYIGTLNSNTSLNAGFQLGGNSTWCNPVNSYNSIYISDATSFSGTIDTMRFFEVSNIYLVTNGDSVSASYQGFSDTRRCRVGLTPTYFNVYNGVWFRPDPYSFCFSNRSSSSTLDYQTEFSGLSSAVNYIYNHFRYVNVYLDGVLISQVSTDVPSSGTVAPDDISFPDVIRSGDGDLSYDLVVPDTLTGDAFFDLTALLSRIFDMINDNSATADKTLTLDDVSDLVVDDEGTQVNTKTVVVSKVISDSLDITGSPPAPSGSPVPVDPFDHPVLYFPSVDSGSGSSILAELIHATDVVLPDDLMLAVWGALGALFVLGVIHILHK